MQMLSEIMFICIIIIAGPKSRTMQCLEIKGI